MLKRITVTIKYTKTQIRKLEEIFKKYLGIDLNKLIEEEIQNIEDYNILYKSLNVKVSIPKKSIAIANILSKYKNELMKKDKKLEKTLNKLFTIDNLEEKIIEEINKKRPKEELEKELQNKIENYFNLLRKIDKEIVLLTFPEIFLEKYKNKNFLEIYNTIKEKEEYKNVKISNQEQQFYEKVSNGINFIISLLKEFDTNFKKYITKERKEKALEILSYNFDKFIIGQKPEFEKKEIQIINKSEKYPPFLKREEQSITTNSNNIYSLNSSKSKDEIEAIFKYLSILYKSFYFKFYEFIEENKKKFLDTKFTRGIILIGSIYYKPYYIKDNNKIEIFALDFFYNIKKIDVKETYNTAEKWGIYGNITIDFLISNLLGIKEFKTQLDNNPKIKDLYEEIEELNIAIKNYYKITKFSKKINKEIKNLFEKQQKINNNLSFEY